MALSTAFSLTEVVPQGSSHSRSSVQMVNLHGPQS
jgi:hypothetical protein